MPKNVMKLLKPSPHRARNDFDLSHRSVFTQNFGELLPSLCLETVPGDHIEISHANLLRAMPLVTSPFMRAKQHVDLWFVPYHDLWHQFDAFITQKSEPVSSSFKGADFCPHVSIDSLYAQGASSSNTDIAGIACNRSGAKLLNLLGYADSAHASSTNPAQVNLWRLAAYNFIWYNEYRQQYFDDGMRLLDSGSHTPAFLFNFDDLVCLTNVNSGLYTGAAPTNRIAAMCQMRYRCWKKDLYTGLLPARQFGLVSTFGEILDQRMSVKREDGSSIPANSIVQTANSAGTERSLYAGAYVTGQQLSLSLNGYTPDVLALRRSEAIQIWRENALRAGNHIKDNMIAHYGVASDFNDHRPTYIGSVDAPLNIGDVVATSNSNYSGNTNPNTNVGDVAGKGLSSIGDNKFKFDAKDFGVIMAISCILPEAEYNAQGIDRMNQLLESEDFFIPEYENLGLEAVGSANFVNTPTSVAKVVGYAPRYFGYKTKLDKCFGQMMTGQMYASWTSPKSDISALMATPPANIPLKTLYVDPALFDVNFSVSLANSEQFLNDSYWEVDAVRPMSVTGMPFS